MDSFGEITEEIATLIAVSFPLISGSCTMLRFSISVFSIQPEDIIALVKIIKRMVFIEFIP